MAKVILLLGPELLQRYFRRQLDVPLSPGDRAGFNLDGVDA
eukprot:CAMPEP_0197721062 /NCGR_PEP_ID=MMETSP1434-20131217/4227_1 /TAXON_ID=265543 /ORGANISM="Minutocellus polymorphus, Strain CCMP3303" /LENGTH=40 /DNA_ID= /DNA_START= /DNA_END= /DNA_ORIENTATION=